MNRDVPLKKYAKKMNHSYTFGAFPTIELLKNQPEHVLKVLLHPDMNSETQLEIITDLCNRHNIPIERAAKVVEKLRDKENIFAVGVFEKYTNQLDPTADHIVLVNPSDMGNMGTIIRTSIGFGIENLAIIEPGVDVFNPKVVRASMGSLFQLNFCYFQSFEAYKEQAGNRSLYPFMLKGAVPLQELQRDTTEIYSLIFGNEATGLPDSFADEGQSVVIRHTDHIDSLNLALATGIGQAATLVIYLVVYSTTESPVHLRRKALRPDLSLEGRLYAIGVPAILNLALPSLLVTFLNGLLAAFSQSYVVVLGIYYKLQTFLYLPANGIVQGMRPLIGYNYGAKEHARVAKLYQLTLGMSAVIMAAGTVICMAASAPLIGLFSSTPETIAIGQTALRIICLGFVVSAVSTTSSGALEGLGKGVPSLVISLCRYIIFIMPIAWVLCGRMGPTGVWHAFWITEALSAVIAYAVYHKAVHQK